MDSDQVIICPIVTEKSNAEREVNKYAFKVDPRSNKLQIIRAIEELFEVKPVKCNIINVKPKPKRVRYKLGYTASWKKAIVTLSKNDKIAIFEGA